jgi:hypothetical protein
VTTRHLLSAKVGTNIVDKGGRWVGIIRSQTKATEFVRFVVPDFAPIYLIDPDINNVDRETDKEVLPPFYEISLVILYNKGTNP